MGKKAKKIAYSLYIFNFYKIFSLFVSCKTDNFFLFSLYNQLIEIFCLFTLNGVKCLIFSWKNIFLMALFFTLKINFYPKNVNFK